MNANLLTEGDIKNFATLDLNAAWSDYKALVSTNEPGNRPWSFSQVLKDRVEHKREGLLMQLGMTPVNLLAASRGMSFGSRDAALADMFFKTENRALFPEYILQKLFEEPIIGKRFATLDDVIGGRVFTQGDVMRRPILDDTEGPLLAKVGTGAGFPKTTLGISDTPSIAYKLGAEFDLPYETRRRYNIDMVEVWIRRVRQQMMKDAAKEAINVMVASIPATDTATSQVLKFTDMSDLSEDFNDGFDPSRWLIPVNMTKKMFALSEFKDPILFDRAKTGQFGPILGGDMKRIAADTDLGTDAMIYFDQLNGVLQQIEAGSEIQEVDKFITRQVDVVVVSLVTAFFRMFDNAVAILQLKT
ncbi:MAG: hypothetical protein P9M15_00915 [Candidatus Electryoneaceae bacterium]|nr:hypothetical protein [Candidatus Electryoneaceae bacterium]